MNIDDFRDEKGEIDWKAYRQAEIDTGERCYRCGDFIMLSFVCDIVGSLFNREPKTPQKRLCPSCKSLDEKTGDEVTHERYIRCPKCGHQDDITDWDCDWGREKYEEGDHEVTCNSCEYEFIITTNVSYSYTSPPTLNKGDVEDG